MYIASIGSGMFLDMDLWKIKVKLLVTLISPYFISGNHNKHLMNNFLFIVIIRELIFRLDFKFEINQSLYNTMTTAIGFKSIPCECCSNSIELFFHWVSSLICCFFLLKQFYPVIKINVFHRAFHTNVKDIGCVESLANPIKSFFS